MTARLLFHPKEQRLAHTCGSRVLLHHEIVDLQVFAAVELVADPIAAEAQACFTFECSHHGVVVRDHCSKPGRVFLR